MHCPRRFIALTAILLVALVSVGVVQGLWTDRWVPINISQQALEAEMEKLPLTIGTWEGKALQDNPGHHPIDDANMYVVRRYVNQLDGSLASVMLTRGRPGPMVIKHLPTECYPSSGYQLIGQAKRFLSQSPDAKVADEFWMATFKKTDVVPTTVRIFWSWSGAGQWQTPDRPRMTFARHPVLYKLYVVRALANENDEMDASPVHDFIKELTRAMRESFFSGTAK